MDLLNSRINRRTLGGITAGAAATAGIARLAFAQDATPDVEEVIEDAPVSAATLAELENVGQVRVVANDRSYAVYQAGENQPGWYVFTLENASESDANVHLARLPEGVGVGDFTSALWQVSQGNIVDTPEWFVDVDYAGGAYAPIGGSNSAMVNLGAGEWVLFSSLAVSTQSVTTFKVLGADDNEAMGIETVATPEGGIVAPEDFGSSFTVSLADGAINADSNPAVGLNTIGVRNDASGPATFVVLHSTETVDAAAAGDLAAAYLSGEATDATLAGGMGGLSPDAYGYFELNAEAGSYVGFSSMVDYDGTSQLEAGAVIVFDVN